MTDQAVDDVTRSATACPVATNGEFSLFERESQGSWRNSNWCGSIRKGAEEKWWLGWNGERFAGGRDHKVLAEHDPENGSG